MSRIITTFFYVGLLKPAPGTWGSLAALPVAWALHIAGGPVLLVAATVAVAAVGWWATAVEVAGAEDQDPSEIVIDEVVGQWIALWPVSVGAAMAGTSFTALWPGIVTAFLAFRLFDIWKPGPVGLADRQKGPTGVMLDDIVAGWLAAMVVALAAVVAHGLMRI
jgi:phosphatidylglycerophosphatase A